MFRVAILTVSLAAIMLTGLITPVDVAQMTIRTYSHSVVSEDVVIHFQSYLILIYVDCGQIAAQI